MKNMQKSATQRILRDFADVGKIVKQEQQNHIKH